MTRSIALMAAMIAVAIAAAVLSVASLMGEGPGYPAFLIVAASFLGLVWLGRRR
jgi:hypothetical protein